MNCVRSDLCSASTVAMSLPNACRLISAQSMVSCQGHARHWMEYHGKCMLSLGKSAGWILRRDIIRMRQFRWCMCSSAASALEYRLFCSVLLPTPSIITSTRGFGSSVSGAGAVPQAGEASSPPVAVEWWSPAAPNPDRFAGAAKPELAF